MSPRRAMVQHPVFQEFNYMVESFYDPETKTAGVILRQRQDEKTLIANGDRREGCVFIALDSFPQLQAALLAMGRAARQEAGAIRIIMPSGE